MVQVHLGPQSRSSRGPGSPVSIHAGIYRFVMGPTQIFDLQDWRRQVFDLYRRVREATDRLQAWDEWRSERDRLFRAHGQSPLTVEQQGAFAALDYFPHDDRFRVTGAVEEAEPKRYDIQTSGNGSFAFTRFARVGFKLLANDFELELYWLEGYGGGIFLPFRDTTSGRETYGGGRYLLDTVKGADLGEIDGRVVLDFNFAYNPSCSYDPRWVCPLCPPENQLDIAIEAGERHH